MSIRLGIIGLSADPSAWATVAHVAPLKSPALSDRYKITALATSSPETAKVAAKAHGVPEDKAYHDAEAIANDPDVDMVVVSVKLALHKQMAVAALKAKKQVYVEWPLAHGLQEAEELAALAKKQGVKTAVGLQQRLSPSVLKAKEIIDSGTLGRIMHTTVVVYSKMASGFIEKYSYINDPKSGADIISIPTTHMLDPLCFLLSEFKSLNATTAITDPTVRFKKVDGTMTEPVERKFVDSISIQGILESGTIVSFSLNASSDATPEHLEWVIAGEKGSLKFEGPSAFITSGSGSKLYQYTPSERAEWEEVKYESGTFGAIGEVYKAYAEGKADVVDFDAAVKRHRMVEAIYRSAEKGTRESYQV